MERCIEGNLAISCKALLQNLRMPRSVYRKGGGGIGAVAQFVLNVGGGRVAFLQAQCVVRKEEPNDVTPGRGADGCVVV